MSSLQASANKLIDRLKDPEVQSAIDESGKTKRKTGLSWDSILNAVFEYVICEADVLQNSSKLTDDTLFRKKKVIHHKNWLYFFVHAVY